VQFRKKEEQGMKPSNEYYDKENFEIDSRNKPVENGYYIRSGSDDRKELEKQLALRYTTEVDRKSPFRRILISLEE
jgi:hypothetical protein